MRTPVMDALEDLVREDSVSFHFPGHKGRLTNIDWARLMPMIDTTETRGMDNLLEPRGIIKESQEEAAKVFGAKHTIYGVNGSTGSNYIALSTVTNKGDKILVQRNCHKSVYNAMILNELEPIYLFPNYNSEYELTTGVRPSDVEKALEENPDIKVVILTNPNYYGICSDIKTIAEIVHRDEKRILIVDEAHGPHIALSDKYPESAIKSGADIVIHSTHKTLPSLTQTSLLHVCTGRVDMNKLRDRYQLHTTTSPSYLFTLSNEMSVAFMAEEGRKSLNENYEYLLDVRRRLGEIKGVTVLEIDPNDDTIFDLDICRITIDIVGYKGQELMKILYDDYNIRMEMSDYYSTLAVATVMNNVEDYEILINAVKEIANREERRPIRDLTLDMPKPVISMCPSEAYFAHKKLVNIEDSIGEVAATPIIPYPPGVPLLATGELITKEIYDYLLFLLKNDVNVVNLVEDRKKIVVVEQ